MLLFFSRMATNSFLQSPDKFSGSFPGLAQQLPQIATETELQKLLADERMRSQKTFEYTGPKTSKLEYL
jgi:hypothetical protein